MKAALIWAAAGALITIYLCTFHNAVNYSDDKWDQIYMDYVTDFRKSYASVDLFAARKEVFKANYLIIDNHNKNPERTYEMGLNQFSDWTQEEFEAILTRKSPTKRTVTYDDSKPMLEWQAIDWTKKGVVKNVRDQGSCGSCWAFSATATLESALEISGQKVKGYLSPQELMDCSRKYGNAGCNGGLETNAFKYVRDNGIGYDDDYPYTQKDGTSCKSTPRVFHIKTYEDVPNGVSYVQNALLEMPLSVGVDATNWNRYSSGVFSDCGTRINHGVELVGITEEGDWVIKNSWGSRYGEKGYIRLKGNADTCGIAREAAFPVV